jgi:hypothetical protein
MNWDAVGAIGEIVGAGAVVLTLIYLTVQLRQNTKAVQHSSERGAFEDGQAWLYRMVENPEIASLYRLGLMNDELSPDNAMRFRFLMQLLFNHWHHVRRHDVSGLVSVSDISGVLSTPGGSRYWKRARQQELSEMDPEFVQFLDDILANVESRKDVN